MPLWCEAQEVLYSWQSQNGTPVETGGTLERGDRTVGPTLRHRRHRVAPGAVMRAWRYHVIWEKCFSLVYTVGIMLLSLL